MQTYRPFVAAGNPFKKVARLAMAALLLAGVSLAGFAQTDEDTGRKAAEELRVLVSEGTGVIGDLQPAINSGKTVKEKVTPDAHRR